MLSNLIIRPEKLGDIVVSTPLFRAFKESFPDQQLHLLTDEASASVIEHDPYLDRIITLPWRGAKRSARPSLREIRSLLKQNGPYERAAILYANWEPWNWLLWSLGVRHVAQIGGTVSAKLLGHSCVLRKGYISAKHMSDLLLDVAGQLGAATQEKLPRLYVAEEERTRISTRFPFLLNPGKIFVHPFCLTAMANLSPAAYMKLCTGIVENPAYHIYLIGTARELAHIEVPKHPRISTSLVGQLSISELMAALSFSDLVMGGSSGIVHMAAALGVPTLGLYCPYAHHHEAWGPSGPYSKTLTVPLSQCRREGALTGPCQAAKDSGFCDIGFAFTVEQILREISALIKMHERKAS